MSKTVIWTISMPETLEKQALFVMGDKMKSEFVREVLRKYIEKQMYTIERSARKVFYQVEGNDDRITQTLAPSEEVALYTPAKVIDKKKVLEILKQTAGSWGKGPSGARYQRTIRREAEGRFKSLWGDI